MAPSDAPVFNLKAVLRETGLKADVLRAWERRYGMPMPKRTPGGHRVYSPRDVETIKWLLARQAEGLSISRAVDLWRETEAASQDPLLQAQLKSRAADSSAVPASSLESMRKAWLDACLAYDEPSAEEVLAQAFAIHPVERVCVDLLQSGLAQIGWLWYRGEASVQQEHFASALAMRRLDALLSAAPAPSQPKTVLAACPPQERHTFSLLLLTLLIRRRGFNVVYLGADVPLAQLEQAMASVRPALVVLAAQQLTSAASLRRVAASLAQRDIQTAYGGRIFNTLPDLRRLIPAHFLGQDVESGRQAIENLALNPLPIKELHHVEGIFITLLEEYRRKRPLVELVMREDAAGASLTTEFVEIALQFFGDMLEAALDFGNPAYLESDLIWLLDLLPRHSAPAAALPPFLRTYSHALTQTLGQQAAPATSWVDLFAARIAQAVTPS